MSKYNLLIKFLYILNLLHFKCKLPTSINLFFSTSIVMEISILKLVDFNTQLEPSSIDFDMYKELLKDATFIFDI